MDLEEETYSTEEGHRSHAKKRKKKKSKHHDDPEELEEVEQETDAVVVDESEMEGLSSPSKKKKKKKSKEAEPVEDDEEERPTPPVPSTSSKAAAAPPKKTASKNVPAANNVQGLLTVSKAAKNMPDAPPKKVTKNGKAAAAARSLKPSIHDQSTAISRKANLNKAWDKLTSDAVVAGPSKGAAGEETEERTAFNGMQILANMSQDDIEELLRKIDLQCPVNDSKRDRAREGQISWGEVAFSCYGPVQCKSVWFYLRTQARTFRIMHEVVDEIRMNFKADYWRFMKKVIETSPGFPKHPYPTGGFQFFCKDLWDKYKVLQTKMNAQVGNFLKFQTQCYQQWKDLSDERREEYHKKAKVLTAEHKVKVKEYYAKFPGFAPRTDTLLDKDGNPEKKKQLTGVFRTQALKVSNDMYKDAPPLPMTPLQLFVSSKLNRLDPPPTMEEVPDLKHHYVKKWTELADSKKLKWIKSCIKKSEQYLEDVEEYKKGHPLYLLPKEFKISRLMSKDEFNMWAKAHGQPPKPCFKSFDVFLEEFRSNEGVDGGDDGEITRQAVAKWEALDWYNKELYKMKLKMQQMTFKKDFEEYYNKLPVVLRAYAIEHLPKKYRRAIEENVGKTPLVLDDEEPVAKDGDKDKDIDEPKSKKRKHNASTNDESSQEETLEGDGSSPKKKKKKKRKKNEDEELEDPLAAISADGNEPSEGMPLYMMNLTENVRKYPATYNPGKTITQHMLGEAMRGIFDGRQYYRRFTPYYYYAKYVIGEECWADMIRKCGIIRTAGKMIETFHRLGKRQQEIFIHESLKFHKTNRKYPSEISTAEDPCAPKLRYFTEEPKPPPRSAEALYQYEMRKRKNDTEEDQVTPWADLDEKVQMVYLKKLYILNRNYVTDYEKFVKNMTPNDMVEYLVGRCHEWEVVRRRKPYASYRGKLIDAAAPMFASETYRAELSDDGQESEPEVYELNGSISKAMRGSAFRYKKNPFEEKTSQVTKYVDRLSRNVRLKLQRAAKRKKPLPIKEVDSDLPSSDDDDNYDLVLNKYKYRREKKFNDKVRELERYYYPLEEYYNFSPSSNQGSSKSWMEPLEGSKGKTQLATSFIRARLSKVDQSNEITTNQTENVPNKPTTPKKRLLSPVKSIKKKYQTGRKSRQKLKKTPKTPEFIIEKPKKAKRVKVILPKFIPPLPVEEENESESAEIDDSAALPQITEVFSLPRDTETTTIQDIQEEPVRMPSLMLVTSSPRSERVDQEVSSTDEMPRDDPDKDSDTTVTKVESSSDDLDDKDKTANTIMPTDFPQEFALDLPSPELFPVESTIEDECDPYSSMYLESQFTAEETDQFNFPY